MKRNSSGSNMIANIINVVEPSANGGGDHPHEERQKDQLPSRAGAAENTESESAPGDEPAVTDRRRQSGPHSCGAQTRNHILDQKELPELVHYHRPANTGGQQSQTAEV